MFTQHTRDEEPPKKLLRKTKTCHKQQQPQQQQQPAASDALIYLPRNIIVCGKYRIGKHLGSGSFGELYRGTVLDDGREVAIKLEHANVKYPQLPREAKIYHTLTGGTGFPQIHDFGTDGIHNIMVLDLLGPSLEDLLNFCGRKFSPKTTMMLADQIISRVRYLHSHSLLHRDIKPDNLLMGVGHQHTRLFMIDFGLSKRYYFASSGKHLEYHEQHNLVGTARYASIHAHFAEQGRRDDLESVGYVLIYFLKGSLPWQGIHATTRKQKYEKILEVKNSLPLMVLCGSLPFAFYNYLKYCRDLHFGQKPDYAFLRDLFRHELCKSGLLNDHEYDWLSVKAELDKKQMLNHNEKKKLASKTTSRTTSRVKLDQLEEKQKHFDEKCKVQKWIEASRAKVLSS